MTLKDDILALERLIGTQDRQGVEDMRAIVRRVQSDTADMLAALDAVANCPQAAVWLARLPVSASTVYAVVVSAIDKANGAPTT